MTQEDIQAFSQMLTIRNFLQSQLEYVDSLIVEWAGTVEEGENNSLDIAEASDVQSETNN